MKEQRSSCRKGAVGGGGARSLGRIPSGKGYHRGGKQEKRFREENLLCPSGGGGGVSRLKKWLRNEKRGRFVIKKEMPIRGGGRGRSQADCRSFPDAKRSFPIKTKGKTKGSPRLEDYRCQLIRGRRLSKNSEIKSQRRKGVSTRGAAGGKGLISNPGAWQADTKTLRRTRAVVSRSWSSTDHYFQRRKCCGHPYGGHPGRVLKTAKEPAREGANGRHAPF